jgi:hypothetical protein
LRGDDCAQGIKRDRAVGHKIIEGANHPAVFGDRYAAHTMLLHQPHDVTQLSPNIAGDHVFRHDLVKRSGLGVDAAPENRERKIAIRDDPGKRLGPM